jgi:hypothetical protein
MAWVRDAVTCGHQTTTAVLPFRVVRAITHSSDLVHESRAGPRNLTSPADPAWTRSTGPARFARATAHERAQFARATAHERERDAQLRMSAKETHRRIRGEGSPAPALNMLAWALRRLGGRGAAAPFLAAILTDSLV